MNQKAKWANELIGWIQPCDPEMSTEDAQAELEKLGVNIGRWDSVVGEFKDCIVPETTMAKLDPL